MKKKAPRNVFPKLLVSPDVSASLLRALRPYDITVTEDVGGVHIVCSENVAAVFLGEKDLLSGLESCMRVVDGLSSFDTGVVLIHDLLNCQDTAWQVQVRRKPCMLYI
jgi:hypothetical protein